MTSVCRGRRIHATRHATLCRCHRRRSALLTAPLIAASSSLLLPHPDAARASQTAEQEQEQDKLYPFLPTTLIRELVPRQVYVYEQAFALGVVATPLRSTVILLENGSLWLHNPVRLTSDIHRHMRSSLLLDPSSSSSSSSPRHDDDDGDENGDGDRHRHFFSRQVRPRALYVVCGTYAFEHCQYARAYAEAFSDTFDTVELWMQGEDDGSEVAGTFTTALDEIRETFMDEEERRRKSTKLINTSVRVFGGDNTINEPPEWADEIESETLSLGTQAGVTIRETLFWHKKSRSVIVSDLLLFISGRVPDELVIPRNTLQTIAKRTTLDDTPDPSASSLLDGWKKLVLLVLFFTPEHEELAIRFTKNNVTQRRSITEANEVDTVPAIRSEKDAPIIPELFEYWSSGWEDNFDALRGKVFVSPVTRLLLLELPISTLLVPTTVKEKRLHRLHSLRGFVDRVIARWPGPWERIIGSHFDVADEEFLSRDINKLGSDGRQDIDGLVKTAFREAFQFVDAAMIEDDDNRLDALQPYAFNERDLRALRVLQRKFL